MKTFGEYLSHKASLKEGKLTKAEVVKAHKQYKAIREAVERSMNKRSLRESAKPTAGNFKTLLSNFRKYQEAKTGKKTLSYSQISSLKEAYAKAKRMGRSLKEADPNFMADQQMGAPAPQAPVADGAAPAAPAANGDIQAQIQSLLSQVEALATSVGISTGNDFEADPMSDIPPAGDQQPADPATQSPAPTPIVEAIRNFRKANPETVITESIFNEITADVELHLNEDAALQERIARRQAKLVSMKESACDYAKEYLKFYGVTDKNFSRPYGAQGDSNPIPAVGVDKLKKGYSDGKAAKETKPASDGVVGSIAANVGNKTQKSQVKESSVIDRYVENYYAPKLDFNSLKESMNNGIFG